MEIVISSCWKKENEWKILYTPQEENIESLDLTGRITIVYQRPIHIPLHIPMYVPFVHYLASKGPAGGSNDDTPNEWCTILIGIQLVPLLLLFGSNVLSLISYFTLISVTRNSCVWQYSFVRLSPPSCRGFSSFLYSVLLIFQWTNWRVIGYFSTWCLSVFIRIQIHCCNNLYQKPLVVNIKIFALKIQWKSGNFI